MRPCRAPYSSSFFLRLPNFSLVGNIIDHGRTKPNAETAVCGTYDLVLISISIN